jgi:hypothetical protein
MVRVRSNSSSPLVIGAVRLDKRGDEGSVSPAAPGVRLLIDAGRLEVIEGDASLPSLADELAAVRSENTRLVAENEALKADVVRLNALNEGMRMADRPKKGG